MKCFFTITLVLLFSLTGVAQKYGYMLADSVDLNSDGNLESIKFDIDTINAKYTLTINNEKYLNQIHDCISCVYGFKVTDIDTTDRFKEVVVEVPYIAAFAFDIFSYDKKIIKAASTIIDPIYKRNGIIYSAGGPPGKTVKHQLNNQTMKLDEIEQPFYAFGAKVVVSGSFSIYQDVELTTKIENIEDNSKIEVLLSKELFENSTDSTKTLKSVVYLIKSENRIIGWTSFDTLMYHTSLFNAG